ncbi:xanthine dehydrogenase accessory protein XdhC [Dongia rigui]|uniref:Xanthine dehydrogenase accessory protein XdhC n=1 Tax=Dongia rigui TaxID=940149 RepID=A0ABU5DUU3_9PROT|nr:xanthine dehydrogenase accessory protein XdhC [Dongia rigui]MDY0871071.1 xanthine dehydrogenase accessory protein XdhC [Dongia rigui]
MSGRPADPVLAAALKRLQEGMPAVLATIAATRGSTPRVPGTRMLVDATGIVGSVGGGQLEFEIIASARDLLASNASATRCQHFILGPDLRQCCGGALDIVLERLMPESLPWLKQVLDWEFEGAFWEGRLAVGDPSSARRLHRLEGAPSEPGTARLVKSVDGAELVEMSGRPWPQLYLFGAGHVGRALVRLLGDLPFHVTWCDGREDIFPAEIPMNTRCDAAADIDALIKGAPADAHFLIMTHSHALDFDLVAAVLAKERFGSLGLIGSDTKKARFLQRLRADGVAPGDLARLQCPVGIPGIKSKVPAAIAIAVAAELLVLTQAREQEGAVTGVQSVG